jgi:hypothetical protein
MEANFHTDEVIAGDERMDPGIPFTDHQWNGQKRQQVKFHDPEFSVWAG